MGTVSDVDPYLPAQNILKKITNNTKITAIRR
jgi:hypothetical protein